MLKNSIIRVAAGFALLLFCAPTIWQPMSIYGQDGESVSQLEKKVEELLKQVKYTEALPLLEKLLIAEPNNPRTHFDLGFALMAQANVTNDATAKKSLRIRARNEFIKSKELGIEEPIVDALIQSMAPDGSEGAAVSGNEAAVKIMAEAEAYFAQGKLDKALKNYQRALELDPKLYEAALFSGDVYVHREDFKQAEFWYQKAISIDPNRETAYRYSATPFMKQRKFEEARDRYVEAYITEPYNGHSVAGLTQWADVTNTRLAHPKIDVPTSVTIDDKGDVKIDLDASLLMSGKEDGSFAWLTYGGTRKTWIKEKFATEFPQEKTYRHSLAEEAEALRNVVRIATGDPKVKNLSPALAKLKKLNDEGLLEAYILFVRVDQGISEDHPAYLAANRDKLRRYTVQYILTGGGK